MEHLENKDYKEEQFIDSLVDQYKAQATSALQLKLLNEFHSYFTKYSNLLCSFVPMDLSNHDTMKFLKLFMIPEDRLTEQDLIITARKLIPYLRSLFRDYSKADLYNEMVVFFLELVERYKPMIASSKHSKERISFVHYMQVNIRFKLKALVKLKQRDALSNPHNVEFDDAFDLEQKQNLEPGANYNDIDLKWVRGGTSSTLFRNLSEMDRYILFLKFHVNPDKPASDYKIADLTGMNRVYLRRKYLKIKAKLKELIHII
jgi:hypothetical protein